MAEARLRAERLAALRRAAGLLQTELAAKLGTSDRRVGEWERGQAQPQPRYLVAAAQALGVEVLELLDVDAHDPPLLALRLSAGLTLHQLAAASGIAVTTYVRLENGNGRGEPGPEMAQALAAGLGVTSDRVGQAIARSRAEHTRRP